MKLLAIILVVATAIGALYAGDRAVRSFRASLAIRAVRIRGAD